MVRIDAHQHFWRYRPAEYPWIDQRMGRIRRDFLPADLAPELSALGIDGTIAVQARAAREETRFLLELAAEHAFVRAVVGWVDLCASDVERELEELVARPALRGVRHPVQDEPDERFLLRPDFQRGIACLERHGLVYDLLIHPRHLEAAEQLVAAFPGQAFVLDHLAKPPIAARTRAGWERGFRALARHANTSCKVSGLVTEAAWDGWEPADFRPYLDAALEAFGPERLLFGSDWPVCLVAVRRYSGVVELVGSWAEELAPAERAALFGGNAGRIYRLA
jgi:L-fuconolactonase